jgi:hypothetical protein
MGGQIVRLYGVTVSDVVVPVAGTFIEGSLAVLTRLGNTVVAVASAGAIIVYPSMIMSVLLVA